MYAKNQIINFYEYSSLIVDLHEDIFFLIYISVLSILGGWGDIEDWSEDQWTGSVRIYIY